jgi:hypothetical protein
VSSSPGKINSSWTVPCILQEASDQLHAPATLPPAKEPPIPIEINMSIALFCLVSLRTASKEVSKVIGTATSPEQYLLVCNAEEFDSITSIQKFIKHCHDI